MRCIITVELIYPVASGNNKSQQYSSEGSTYVVSVQISTVFAVQRSTYILFRFKVKVGKRVTFSAGRSFEINAFQILEDAVLPLRWMYLRLSEKVLNRKTQGDFLRKRQPRIVYHSHPEMRYRWLMFKYKGEPQR